MSNDKSIESKNQKKKKKNHTHTHNKQIRLSKPALCCRWLQLSRWPFNVFFSAVAVLTLVKFANINFKQTVNVRVSLKMKRGSQQCHLTVRPQRNLHNFPWWISLKPKYEGQSRRINMRREINSYPYETPSRGKIPLRRGNVSMEKYFASKI